MSTDHARCLPPDAPALRKRRKWLRALGCAGVLLLVCGGGFEAVVYFAIPPYSWKGWIDDERKVPPKWEPPPTPARVRSGGYACRPAAPGGDGERTLNRWVAWRGGAEGAVPASDTDEVRSLVRAAEPAIGQLHREAALPFGPQGAYISARADLSARDHMTAARLASAAALLAQYDGRDDEALSRLEDVVALAGELGARVGGSTDRAGTGCYREAHGALLVILRVGAPSDAAIEHYLRSLAGYRARLPGRRDAVQGAGLANAQAVLVTVKTYAGGRLGDEAGWDALPAVMVARDRLKSDASREWLEDRVARILEAMGRSDARESFRGALAQALADAATRGDAAAGRGLQCLLEAVEARDRLEQLMVCDETVCALELYRRQAREWPASLAELVPRWLAALPPDVYSDGATLHYHRLEVGYRLYSVGPDGEDGGGAVDFGATASGDLVLADWSPMRNPYPSVDAPSAELLPSTSR